MNIVNYFIFNYEFLSIKDDNVSSDNNGDSMTVILVIYLMTTMVNKGQYYLNLLNILKTIYMLIKDRNYKNNETFNYNVKDNSNINSSDNGMENAYFSRNYNNIKSISVEGVLLPNLYVNIDELHGLKLDIIDFGVRLKKIRDLDYVTMNIDGYESNIDGTNKVISSASNVLIVDDTKERVNNSGTTSNQLAESIVVGEGKNIVIGTSKSL